MKDLQKLTAKLKGVLAFFRKYAAFLVFVVVILAYSFMVWRIYSFTNQEPSQQAIDDKISGVKSPTIDQNAIGKIQELQSHNVQVQTLFQQARDNPFQE